MGKDEFHPDLAYSSMYFELIESRKLSYKELGLVVIKRREIAHNLDNGALIRSIRPEDIKKARI